MNYVGIDWAYGQAAFCAMGEGGEIAAEGLIPANEDGLTRLILKLGTEASGCVEMMSGAVWVRDRLEAAGWQMKVAHARKVRDIAPLACKTDKVDARVLAELCRRDLVPELWLPSGEDRALRERLRRRAHLVKVRTSARNRIFGLLTQFGLRIPYARLGKPDGIELLSRRGVPEVWRASIRELLELVEEMDRRIEPIERELGPLARRDERARLLATIPGVGPLLSLTFAAEIGEVSRFRSPGKLIAYAGLAPRVSQSGERSQTGALSKAGSRTLRWAAVEAANQAWRPSNPWHRHYLRVTARHGKNPAKSSVARKLLIAAWHMLSRDEPFKPPARKLPRRAPAAF
jgi:transposase